MAERHEPRLRLKHAPGPTNAIVARQVRALREGLGWTQVDLAGALRRRGSHLDQTAVSRIEANDRRVTVDDLTMLAGALGANSPYSLLSDGPPMTEAQARAQIWQMAERVKRGEL